MGFESLARYSVFPIYDVRDVYRGHQFWRRVYRFL